ncbi:MAG: DUF2273 domain-containing protein [Clostridia bacterium]|nr:DUF2273 domain-containing protein [Clostridia bacterium]
MEDIKKFISKFWGAILGGIIAILLICTDLYMLVLWIVLVGMGIWAGNYYQHYKENIKNKLKKIIDKM